MRKFDLFAGATNVDNVTAATNYLNKRRLHAGNSSSLRKLSRAIRIAHGLRGAPAKAKALSATRPGVPHKPHVPTRPHLLLIVTDHLMDPIVPKKGTPIEVRRAVFIDRSRYPRFPNRAAFEASRVAA